MQVPTSVELKFETNHAEVRRLKTVRKSQVELILRESSWGRLKSDTSLMCLDNDHSKQNPIMELAAET